MAHEGDNPFGRVVGPWEHVMDDLAATAETYRDAGRRVVELHTGDVTVLADDSRTAADQQGSVDRSSRRLGLDVVVPGEEFEHLQTALSDRSVDRYEVSRATGNGMVFLLIEVHAGDLVAILPAYYDRSERDTLERIAREYGLRTHVRPLDSRAVVTVEHADPAPFFPD